MSASHEECSLTIDEVCVQLDKVKQQIGSMQIQQHIHSSEGK